MASAIGWPKSWAACGPRKLAAGPAEALEAIDRLAAQARFRGSRGLHDFRFSHEAVGRPGGGPQDPLPGLQSRAPNCNWSIASTRCMPTWRLPALQASSGARAAGVPLWMEVSVANFGTAPARDVSVLLDEDGADPAGGGDRADSRPARAVTRRFPVRVCQRPASTRSRPGWRATPSRPTTFATRWSTWRPAVPVLIIDGDPRGQDAFFLTSALAPGGKVKSGLSPLVESPRFLRDHALDKYEAIFLLNIERLDPAEIEPLEAYVRARRRRWRSSWASCRRPISSTSICIATARGCFRCRWSGRPSCWSIGSTRRPTWKSPTIRSSRCLPASGTVSSARWWSSEYFAAAEELDAARRFVDRRSSPGCATARRWPSSAASAKAAWSPF